jgi:hypothetical protein
MAAPMMEVAGTQFPNRRRNHIFCLLIHKSNSLPLSVGTPNGAFGCSGVPELAEGEFDSAMVIPFP